MIDPEVKTIRDARAKHYEVFPGKDDVYRGKKEAMLKYIEELGIQTKTDVSEFPIGKFLDSGTGGIILDRRKANSIFFELKQTLADKPSPQKRVMGKTLEKFAGRMGLDYERQIEHQRGRFDNKAKDLREYNRAILAIERDKESITAAIALLEQKQAAKQDVKDHVDSIRRLLKSGIFTLAEAQEKKGLCLITKPLLKTFFSKKQATNLAVPLGQFRVCIWPSDAGDTWFVKAYMHKNNVQVQTKPHPHIDRGGTICMGSAGEAWTKAINKQDLYAAFMAIWDIIANFQEAGGGYIPLCDYEAAYKESLPNYKPIPF